MSADSQSQQRAKMTDKEARRDPLTSSISGIPTRPTASRLQPPMIKTQRSTPALAPISSSPSATQSAHAAARPSLLRVQPTTQINKSVTPRPNAAASKASTTNLRSQKSNGSLKPPAPKPTTPTSPVPRASRPSRAVPFAPGSPMPPRVTHSRKVTASSPNTREPGREDSLSSKGSSLSIKEQIAARRAAMTKDLSASVSGTSTSSTLTDGGGRGAAFFNVTRSGSGFSDWGSVARPEDVPCACEADDDAPDHLLGRPTIRQAIIKALSTGSLNVMSRQLTSLPTSLFTLHLGVTPAPPFDGSPLAKGSGDDVPSGINRWEAVDLTVLKAGDNKIAELQEELGLFGGLKSLDLRKNNLATLPAAFANLTCLTHLDLSHCLFTSVPLVLSSLPALIHLNISHNALTSLSFDFSSNSSDQNAPLSASPMKDRFFYPPRSPRVNKPFPVLQMLLVSNNKISAHAIRPLEDFPRTLVKLDLNHNPLCAAGDPSPDSESAGIRPLFETLGGLKSLKEVLMRSSTLSDAALGHLTLGDASFPLLEALDVGDNDDLSEAYVRRALLASRQGTNDEDGVLVGTHMDILVAGSAARSRGANASRHVVKLVIGRHIVKEAWEIELERRSSPRKSTVSQANSNATTARGVVGENDAVEDEGLFVLGFGRKETRVRRNATASGVNRDSYSHNGDNQVPHSGQDDKHKSYIDPSLPESRLQSAMGPESRDRSESPVGGKHKPRFPLDKYYNDKTHTLALPSAVPRSTRGGAAVHHARSMSLNSPDGSPASGSDVLAPLQTLPHALIVTHLWARTTLRTLVLSNRRADVTFLLARVGGNASLSNDVFITLPVVEELRLDGCNLQSRVKCSTRIPPIPVPPLARANPETGIGTFVANTNLVGASLALSASGVVGNRGDECGFGRPTDKELGLLPTLHRVFPALVTLDLSYNALSTLNGVGDMFLPSSSETLSQGNCASLQTLKVCGNKIDEAGLEELVCIGEKFKLDETCVAPRWRGVEVDIRENEIAKLPGLLGWLPLDILLVESNVFRVPNRRVWERDGAHTHIIL